MHTRAPCPDVVSLILEYSWSILLGLETVSSQEAVSLPILGPLELAPPPPPKKDEFMSGISQTDKQPWHL